MNSGDPLYAAGGASFAVFGVILAIGGFNIISNAETLSGMAGGFATLVFAAPACIAAGIAILTKGARDMRIGRQ